MLREKGAMLCYTDTDAGDSPPVIATAASGYLRLRRTHYEDDGARRVGRAHRGACARARLRLLHARGRRAGRGVRAQAAGTVEAREAKMNDTAPAAGAIERLQALLREERAADRGPLVHLRLPLRHPHGRPRRFLARDRPAALLPRRDPGGADADVPRGGRAPADPAGLFFVKRWYYQYRTALVHFFLGTLLNVYTIFFFKSSSLLVSFGFLAFPGVPAVGQRVRALQVAWACRSSSPCSPCARCASPPTWCRSSSARSALAVFLVSMLAGCVPVGRRRLVDQEQEAGSLSPRPQADAAAARRRADRASSCSTTSG